MLVTLIHNIHVLLLAECIFAAFSAQECDTELSGVVEASLHNKLETRRITLLLSAGA